MKILLATAALAGGLATISAGTASAATPYECEVYAQNYAEQQYPTGGGALTGGVAGGILGGLVAGATGNRVGSGVAIGATAGLVVGSSAWQAKKEEARRLAYAQCIGGPAPRPVVVTPPPAYIPPGPFNGVISGASAVNVRNGPGTAYPVIGQVYSMQGVSVAGCSAGWCQIYLTTGVGYVSQTYVYPVSG